MTELLSLISHHCTAGILQAVVDDYLVFGEEGMKPACSSGALCTLYCYIGSAGVREPLLVTPHCKNLLLHSVGETLFYS